MAYIQKNLPPPIKSSSFTFTNFTGGLNNSTSDSLLRDNQASDILNMAFNEEGTMQKRKGNAKYDSFDYKNPIMFMDRFRTLAGIDSLVVSTETEVYIDKVKICDVSNSISGLTYLGKYYFVDGLNIRIYGVFPQATSGVHIVVTGTPVATNKLMKVVNPPVYTPLATSYTMGSYHYDYTLGTVWYEPCQNELDDSYKGMNIIPSNPSMICLHQDRLFMDGDLINPGNVFITDIMNALYFPVGMPMQLPPNGQPITALQVFMDSVVASRKYDIYVIYGNTNRTSSQDVFIMKKISTNTGMINNKTTVEAHNYLFFLGSDGIAYKMHTTQTDVNVLATSKLSVSLDLFKAPINLDLTKMSTCCAIFDNDKYYLCNTDVTLVYSYNFMAWTLYKGIKSTSALSINDKLILGANDGYIYTSSEEYHDDGVPIVAYYATKMYDFGLTSNYKQFKELYVIAHVFNEAISTINVRYEIDYVDVMQTASIVNQISKWGVAIFGDRFITRNIAPSLPITIGRRGRKFRIIIMNGEEIKQIVATFTDLEAISNKVHLNLYRVTSEDKIYRYSYGNFDEVDKKDLFQPLKVYEINGDFVVKGKR